MTYLKHWRLALAFVTTGIALPAGPALAGDGEAVWTTREYLAGWQLKAVGAAEAYASGFTGEGITVGVVDSGIDTRHAEFSGRLVEGYDFVNDRTVAGAENFDAASHGTHVSGIIAASRDGRGMHGVAFDALLRPVIPNTASSDPDAVMGASWRLLADGGVPIINNSIGINECAEAIKPPCNVTDYEPGQLERELPATIAAMKHAVEKDVLMVFSTGNEGQPAPDALAGMPHWVPELRDNWLAVGAVDAGNNLAFFSNRCGVAAEWCLVAPGVEDYSTVPLGTGTSPDRNYMPESGTSMAAPVVSGIAALVRQAFPFYSAKDLQQTLLTTATDLGNPDAFGRGLVNAGRAVKGYGQFTSGVVLDTKGLDATFGNDIGGAGSLTKTGAGVLTLTGENTYAGGTTVLGGGLAVEGSLRSRVDVGRGGSLSGTGTIEAPLTVAGTLAPGGSGGTLTVSGPVVLGSTATTRFEIGGGGSGTYSRLVATGPVSVGGILVPVLRGADAAPLGARFGVIEASGGVTGSFSRLVQADADGLGPATRFDAAYGANGVALVVTPLAYGDLGANGLDTTGNEDAVGEALDAIRPSAGKRGDPLFSGLYATAPADLTDALGQLSGEIHASVRAMEIERAGMLRDVIGERTSRLGGTGERATFWSSGYGGRGEAEGGGAARFDWETANALFGAEAPVGERVRLGIAGGFGRSEGDIGGRNASAEATHIDLAAYGAARLGAFEVSAGLAHSRSDFDIARRVAFGGFRNTLTDSYDGGLTQGFGELGYRAQEGRLALNPFLSGAYIDLSGLDLDEDGGAGALSGRSASRTLGVTLAGMRISADFTLGGGTLSANAAAGWQRIHGDASGHADLAFGEGRAFEVEGAGLSHDALRLDLGGDYTLGGGFKAGLGYRGAIGGDSVSSSVRGDLSLTF